eukprot:747653-Rhodomonas_salina.1
MHLISRKALLCGVAVGWGSRVGEQRWTGGVAVDWGGKIQKKRVREQSGGAKRGSKVEEKGDLGGASDGDVGHERQVLDEPARLVPLQVHGISRCTALVQVISMCITAGTSHQYVDHHSAPCKALVSIIAPPRAKHLPVPCGLAP